MRIMALDVGGKTIGVAVTDEMGWSAQGLTTIKRTDTKKDIEAIRSYVNEYQATTIVVGLPLRDGEVGIQAGKVLKFVEELKKKFTEVAIDTWDETLTTADAHEVLAQAHVTSGKRKKVVDKLAAVFILESYLRGKSEEIG